MDGSNQSAKRYKHPDRVTLSPTSLSKLGAWHDQISAQVKGITVTKTNLVDWLIESHSGTLSSNECKQLRNKFFDEVRFHEWAVREYKKQRANGLTISLTDFLATQLASERPMEHHRTRSKSSKLKVSSENNKHNMIIESSANAYLAQKIGCQNDESCLQIFPNSLQSHKEK